MAAFIPSTTINWRRLSRLSSVICLAVLAALVLGRPYPAAARASAVPGGAAISAGLTATLSGRDEMTTTIGGSNDSRPLGVIVASLEARSIVNESGNYNVVVWETASELNLLGFNVWRGASADEPTERVNAAMIPSQTPGGTAGGTYNYDDLDVTGESAYYYWLEDVALDGTVSQYGPVMAQGDVPTAVTLTTLQANSRTTGFLWPLFGLAGIIAAGWLAVWRRAGQINRAAGVEAATGQRLAQRD